ncbi:exonuclease SbcC [Spinactinospora alkalitolerans]|uniref:Nuclease SbcCD subunit C n=1 Tax=Spinactinospora alkalitolerans TaxID=687207 RepID=A0A852U3Y9_9ACTN|nr:SMC family ATPase [Spinactinospora alkalitolerans]NYE48824.1 exonuclease SbcC [Spinactinospora alkalitolerans]
MRLHKLTVQAFGPFGGVETVDFGALGDGGLFLIHGPTGAGKTSVLDAVCFALYGQVPGAREAAKSPRSNHARPGLEPEVTLDVTVRGRTLHIVRSPQWERPKKRGTGTTKQNPKVSVTEIVEGRHVPVTTRLDEAGQFINELTGLSREQFCQIVLLPQGDFARFLRAKASERREALEYIFATGVFAQIEKWLEEHARSLGREAEAAETEVSRVADRIAEVGGAPWPEDDGFEALMPWAVELAHVTAATARDAAEAAGALSLEQAGARAALDEARDVARRQDRLAAARGKAAELRERQPWRAALEAETEAAERAVPVVQLLGAVEQRRTQLEKAHLAAADSLSLAGPLAGLSGPDAFPPDPATAGSAFTGSGPADDETAVRARLETAERAGRDEIAHLKRLHGEAARRDEVLRDITELTGLIERRTAERDRARERMAALPDRRAELAADLERARLRTGSRDAAAEALASARTRLEAATEHERLRGESAAAERERTEAVDAAQTAKERALSVRELRIAGMAAEIAAGLAEGEACPVCGSVQHPAPAAGEEGRPTGADEQAAQRAADEAQARREDAERAVAALTEQLAAAGARADGLDRAAAHELVRSGERELAAVEAAAAEVERLAAQVSEAETALEEARGTEARIERELAETVARRAERAEEERRLSALLDDARGDDPDLASRVTRLSGEADLLRSAADALSACGTAVEELRAAEQELERGLAESGFAEAHAARSAARSDAERRGLRERARHYDDEKARVDAELDDPDIVAASRLPAPDLEGAADAAAAAEAAEQRAVSWRDRLADRARRLASLRGELQDRLETSRPARERHAVASGLARLAAGTSGDNRESVQLSAYVLAARLEQVVNAANDRLTTMSGGRYLLRHTVDKTAGDRSRSGGGLGLRVIDAWTGQERDPATLSGGETFVSSLALALGLGDVASAEAGGADIGTLFVDEGFGTLDEDTLEEVLEVLDGLRDGGRAVGVVSHVADLRSRITTRLKVVKSTTGSRVEQFY